MDSPLQERVWLVCYADLARTFEFVLHFVSCVAVTVSPNQIIIIIIIRPTIDPLQRVQNAASRLFAGTGTRDHITPVLRSLHWLQIKLRIQYKLCMIMHLVRFGRSPVYLHDMMTATANLPGHERFRSASSFEYETPTLKLKFGVSRASLGRKNSWSIQK